MKNENIFLVIFALLLVATASGSVNVLGQAVSVSVSQYSERVPIGPPLGPGYETGFANLTVTYSGGNHLIVGIMDPVTGAYLRGRLSSNLPYAIVQQTECQWSEASWIETRCEVITKQASGTLYLGFAFSGPPNTGKWNLQAFAALADNNFNPTNSTVNVSPFAIIIYNIANLYFSFPNSASLKLDGALETPGSFRVSLSVGSNHTLTVPRVISITNASRLTLIELWGYSAYYYNYTNPTDGASPVNLPLHVWQDDNLTSIYVTQYLATVTSPFNATLCGTSIWTYGCHASNWWFDRGSYIYARTVESPQSVSGILGLLGVRAVYDGWFVDGQYFSNSSTASILVSEPLSVEARWHLDYGIQFYVTVIIGAIVCFSVLVGVYVRGKRTVEKKLIYGEKDNGASPGKQVQ